MRDSDFRRLFGVIDLQQGRAVHAVAGCRDLYAPIDIPLIEEGSRGSVMTKSSGGDPELLAEAFLKMGAGGIYVADLDSICHRADTSLPVIEALLQRPVPFWIDLGLSGESPADRLRLQRLFRARRRLLPPPTRAIGPPPQAGEAPIWPAPVWVVPTESIRNLVSLKTWLSEMRSGEFVGCENAEPELGSTDLHFAAGLDLRDGKVISVCPDLRMCTALEAAERLIAIGFDRLCVIDLAIVGTGKGATTVELCDKIRQKYPEVSMIGGGGGRGPEDFQRWWHAGCDAVLSATWLLSCLRRKTQEVDG